MFVCIGSGGVDECVNTSTYKLSIENNTIHKQTELFGPENHTDRESQIRDGHYASYQLCCRLGCKKLLI